VVTLICNALGLVIDMNNCPQTATQLFGSGLAAPAGSRLKSFKSIGKHYKELAPDLTSPPSRSRSDVGAQIGTFCGQSDNKGTFVGADAFSYPARLPRTRPLLLWCWAHPETRIERFNRAFCSDVLPGLTTVPLADAVIFLIESSSVTISRWSRINLAVN
jgi:hypothetical protein